MILRRIFGLALACAALPAAAQDRPDGTEALRLDPAQLFELAEAARTQGDLATAEAAYRALSANPELEVRSEARFRLGMMLADQLGKHREAAVEFRAILDEKPDAARVRLELARMQVMLGDLGAASREFRAAQASGLPPEVQQMVRFYAGALAAQKPYSANIEIALAPDSNINRATRSDTLGTIIGDFTLDEDARAQSGIGLALKGQAQVRTRLDRRARLLVQVGAKADLYRQHEFDDYIVTVQAGPEYASGKDRITVAGTASFRWFGTDPYSSSYGVNATWQHPLGKRTQVRLEGGIAAVDNKRNDLQDGTSFVLNAGIDRAFSARFGGGLLLSGSRDAARDPGYAMTGGGVSGYLYREVGQTTIVGSLGYSRTEADGRLFLYPARRADDRWSASLGATFRALRVGTLAPVVRLRYEANVSPIEIYDFDRVAAEIGLTAAF
jgi:hypothetical protein